MSRPRLLVSVRDVQEAQEALAGGADWIDLKEPRRGALGAVDATVARKVVEFVGERAPVSAAAGELLNWPTAAARQLLAVAEISYLKLGLAGCHGREWQEPWRMAQREIASAGKELVAVAYADHAAARAPCPAKVLRCAESFDCSWVLVDTFDKTAGALHELWPSGALDAYLRSVRATARRTVVAGRLDRQAVSRLPIGLVDMAAIRGAACRGLREGSVCRERVAEVARALQDAAARPYECAVSRIWPAVG